MAAGHFQASGKLPECDLNRLNFSWEDALNITTSFQGCRMITCVIQCSSIDFEIRYFWGTRCDAFCQPSESCSAVSHLSAEFTCNLLCLIAPRLGNDWWGRPRRRRGGQRAGVLADNEEDQSLLNLVPGTLLIFGFFPSSLELTFPGLGQICFVCT